MYQSIDIFYIHVTNNSRITFYTVVWFTKLQFKLLIIMEEIKMFLYGSDLVNVLEKFPALSKDQKPSFSLPGK